MNIYKNSKLIISGTRNRTDGLWDIPIPAMSIKQNYKMPTSHGLYYKLNHTPLTTSHIPPFMQNTNLIIDHYIKKQSQCNKSKPPYAVLPFIKAMNPLIDHNIFNQHLHKHNYEHKANVILRKKQSKVQLAQYLHATCLSLMPRTFITAINNNHFIS